MKQAINVTMAKKVDMGDTWQVEATFSVTLLIAIDLQGRGAMNATINHSGLELVDSTRGMLWSNSKEQNTLNSDMSVSI